MKILFITDGIYPYVLGGMQKHATYLLKQLADTGDFIDVIHCTVNEIDNSKVHLELFGKIVPNIHFYSIPFPSSLKFPGHYIYNSWRYSKTIDIFIQKSEIKYDVIYAKGFTAWCHLKIRKNNSVPVISQLHGLEMFQESYSIKDKLSRGILKIPANFILHHSDYLFTYGGKIRDIYIRKNVPDYKLIEQYGAVDDNWLYPSPELKINGPVRKFVFVARYEFRKGYHILKKVISQLISVNISAEFNIVGEVPEDDKMVHPAVHYHGNLKAEEILQLFNTMEVLLIPSLAEGFPTILVEGMARGLTPIASDVGAINTVVTENNGWLIPPGNENALKSAILESVNYSSDDLQSKQASSVDFIQKNFQWSNTAKNLILQLNNLVNDHRQRSSGK